MLRRILDLPGIEAIERKALMNPRYADADARVSYPEIDLLSADIFCLTADAADEVARPDGWDGIESKPIGDQVAAFEREGWDVTDNRRRPIRTLEHFNVQLWLAIRGVAGKLPFVPDEEESASAWASSLQSAAAKFKRDRR